MDKEKKTEVHITNNFNAPIGQHIDHVDTIQFSMDGDGTFHFGMVENVRRGGNKNDEDHEEAEGKPIDGSKQLNFFAPKKHLQELLKQSWFAEVRTDGKYDSTWTDDFVEALMTSEYGEGIASKWFDNGNQGKCNYIKGYIVGLLKDSGVLSGTYVKLAKIVKDSTGCTIARDYLGEGKKQPYANWVKEYVKG